MEAAVNQTAVRNITMVALSDIQPSGYNPRKHFDETSLNELAESIRQQGVLQPITVRPLAGTDRYEIVFGERRYRASVIAQTGTIPAIISDLSDEEAEEMAITENLQRKDVTPIEEATAYQKLIESGRHTVETLTVLFGKSESYIRTRLKFTSLIPEIAALLEADELTISVAAEICRYGEDIQRDVYDKHLKDDVPYNSWRGMKASDVAYSIERNYTTDLSRYSFDKTLCASCPHNTNNLLLFHDGSCGHCANRSCLAEMSASHLAEKALQFVEQYPTMSLCHQEYNYNETVVERLTAMGYEVVELKYCATAYPETPVVPQREEYDTVEEYEEAYKEYEQDLSDYMEQCKSIHEQVEAGKITPYIRIEQKEVVLCYLTNTASNATGATGATEKELSPVKKLEKQDERNKEIAREKTVADTKKQILKVDMSERKFGADEEKMIYFFLLSSLRKEHFSTVGITEDRAYYLTDEDKMKIVSNLTAKTKAIIRRDFLIANFKEAYGNNAAAGLLLDFARKHMPEALATIENGYNEVYEKRHQRLEEKKAALLEQEQKNASTEEEAVSQPEEAYSGEEAA